MNLKNIVIKAVFYKKTPARFDRKMVKMVVTSNKRQTKLLWIRVLQFLIRGKGRPKKQSPRVQEFLIKESIA